MAEALEVRLSDEQRRSAVWRHPLRERIHGLLAARSPEWIAAWLRDQFPVEDEDGLALPERQRHLRLRISARALEKYRKRFYPELAPGIDVMPVGIEELMGRMAPPPARVELERLESLQNVVLFTLQQAMEQDADLEMLQPLTLEVQKHAASLMMQTAKLKSSLGLPGYEPVAQEVRIESTNHNVNVDLHGATDAAGNLVATEPAKLTALRDLLARPEAEREALIKMAQEDAEIIDAVAEVESDFDAREDDGEDPDAA